MTCRLPALLARVSFAIVSTVFGSLAGAHCFPASGNYSFHGRLSDGKHVGATLVIGSRAAADVTGTVFVEPLYQDIAVVGEINDGNELRLRKKSDGSMLFDGWFIDHLDGMGPLTCDFAAGPWSTGGVAAMHLVGWGFRLDRLSPEEQMRLNEVILDIYNALRTRDAERLARHVRFPLTLGFPNDRGVQQRVSNAKELFRLRSKIFGPKLIDRLDADVPHDPFCRDGECMLGNGVVWIDEHLRVVSLLPG